MIFLDFFSTGSIVVSIVSTKMSSSHLKVDTDTFSFYVPRPNLEAKINSILTNQTSHGVYYIVYGAKGAGKSTLMDFSLRNKPGVFKIEVSDTTSKDDLLQQISKVYEIPSFLRLSLSDFNQAMRRAKDKTGVPPVIVFEIERSKGHIDNPVTIGSVRGIAKAAAQNAQIFVVLSEANAVLEFGRDPHRESFIFVDELSFEETRSFLKGKFTEEEIKYVFQTIGSNPAMLRRLIWDVPLLFKLQDFVNQVLLLADQDLVSFPHQIMLQSLKEHPEGVSPKHFHKQQNRGVDLSVPLDVAVSMKASNAIVFRMDSLTYQLLSTAHRTALSSYTPEEK